MADKSVKKTASKTVKKTVKKSSKSSDSASAAQSTTRVSRSMRGYNRKAIDELLRQKDNELAEMQGQLQRNKMLLDQAQSERAAFLRSLDAAARSADELLEEAADNANEIRLNAQDDAERLRRKAIEEANDIVAVTKSEMAEYEARSEEMMSKVEMDKEALSNYQNELSAYLYQLGEYLMKTSVDPTIALPIEEQPAITGAPPVEETIVLSEIEMRQDEDFAEFFTDDIKQDKSRDWILKD